VTLDEHDPDAALEEELRRLLEKADAPPPEVAAFATAALGWRRLDADLAELLADSLLEVGEPTRAQSDEAARRLEFRTNDLSIDIEIIEDGAALRILGQLSPPPSGATIEVQSESREILARANSDELGRFRLTLETGGRVRLRVQRDPPASPVETSWLSL
jgi:hypothetical protein